MNTDVLVELSKAARILHTATGYGIVVPSETAKATEAALRETLRAIQMLTLGGLMLSPDTAGV